MTKSRGLEAAGTLKDLRRPASEHWRADIDGLRAVAVVPVVVFHVAQSLLRGGFVGVDIFFVISGYLISRKVLRQLLGGKFSVIKFYEHRIRRIFPAYAAVLLSVLAISVWHDLPPDAAGFGRTLLAAVFSVTNVQFWLTTDYFAQPAEELPLLHTWSLSVEEQFYLVFPMLAVLFSVDGQRWLSAVVVAALILSLASSVYGVFAIPTATFYLLPTRAWELLLGTLLALGLLPPLHSAGARNVATGSGIMMIAASMVLLSPYTPFPGLAAVPPCLGAALILHAGESGGSVVARILSSRPFVFVGLISYSLYLWHWPIIVLQRVGALPLPADTKLIERGSVVVLSFVLGWASWWFVERPTRDRSILPTRVLIPGCGVAALLLVATGLTLVLSDGLAGRFKPEAVAVARYLAYDEAEPFRKGRCLLEMAQPISDFDRAECLPNRQGRPTYVVMGDSHAAALVSGLRTVLAGANVLQVTGVACPPLSPPQAPVGRSCADLMYYLLNDLPRTRSITTVWLTARWNASRLDALAGWSDWLDRLKRTAETLSGLGIRAVVIGPTPEFRSALPRLLAEGVEHDDLQRAQSALESGPFELDTILGRYAREHGIEYVSMTDAMCPARSCVEYVNGKVPVFFDSNHLTVDGSVYVAKILVGQTLDRHR